MRSAVTARPIPSDLSASPADRAWYQRVDLAGIALLAITLIAFGLRIDTINWDQNQHLHPDERKITMVAQCLGLQSVPAGCPVIPDPANPHFFAYGSFPMYLLALVANGLARLFAGNHGLPTDGGVFNDYNHITLVGRALSALFDTGTVLVTGLIVRRLLGKWWGAVAAALVACSTINIQLSHFYAVDTVLTFFITLTFFGMIGLALHRPGPRAAAAIAAGELPPLWETTGWAVLTGLAAGLALASKISAAPIALPIALALLLRWRRIGWGNVADIVLATIATLTTTLLTFIVTMPYAFLDSTSFWHDVNEQNNLARGVFVYPYTIQFANRTPYLDQIKNLFLYDLGALFMLAAGAGILVAIARLWRGWDNTFIIPLSWVIVYFGITGSFYMKFPRYQLPIVPALAILATLAFYSLSRLAVPAESAGGSRWRLRIDGSLRAIAARFGERWPQRLAQGLAVLTIAGGLVLSLAYMAIYHQPMTRLAASDWMYANIPAGSNISHEVWDDGLPLGRGTNAPYIYRFTDLNLYDADTPAKADTLANQLGGVDYVVLASNRLYTSITRVPYMYPMTARYYQLLFDGGLGYHLVQTFANHPHFGPFDLPDTQADESYSVYDHPTVWIFKRDPAAAFGPAEIKAKLLDGVNIPAGTSALASQKPLQLAPKDIAANDQNAPLWQRFSPTSWQTQLALPLWWLAIEVLGLLAFPLAFVALPGLRDRGWGLAKALGILGLSWLIWMPASLSFLPYEERTVWLAFLLLGAIGGVIAWRQWAALRTFFREHWRTILLTELITLGAFLAFVAIRSVDPDLWHIWRGGEKPMELTFLNGILRSRTLPPLDPWFSGSYINYYYFGQFLIATLIELTGIVPTTAFNLAIPMLFALTISGALSVVGGITGRWWMGLLAGWGLAVAGNLDGMRQWWEQIQVLQTRVPGQTVIPIVFDYWRSSRVIPFTINEFPFWSFLYADLHAHVIDLPIVLLGLGVAASLLGTPPDAPRSSRYAAFGIAALALGAMACINTWDMPTYGGVIILALLIAEVRALPRQPRAVLLPGVPSAAIRLTAGDPIRIAVAWLALVVAAIARPVAAQTRAQLALQHEQERWAIAEALWSRPVITWGRVRSVAVTILAVVGGAIVLYLPFYTHFQSLYGKIGTVTVATDPILFLTLFGLWLFVIVTFFAIETLDRWSAWVTLRQRLDLSAGITDATQRALALCLVLLVGVTYLVLRGVKPLLIGLLLWGLVLFFSRTLRPERQFAYLLILVGLGVALVVEVVYLKDFLDGSDWERMNTVFKFYYQVWLLFALGGAIALGQIFQRIHLAFQDLTAGVFRADRDYLVAPQPPLALVAPTARGETGPLEFGSHLATVEADRTSDAAPAIWAIADGPATPPSAQANSMPPSSDAFVDWTMRVVWIVVLGALIFGSSVFMVEGTAVRVNDRTLWAQAQPPSGPLPATPSLDGFAYMHAWYPGDADAITWMNEHIAGAPVIVEASADPYQWFGRVSINTGLPAVLGWANHESQQRYPDEVFRRAPDVQAIYSSNDPTTIRMILRKYHAQYLYVGQLECVYYALHDPHPTTPAAASIQQCNAAHSLLGPLQIYQQLVDQGYLTVAYHNELVTLYQVTGKA